MTGGEKFSFGDDFCSCWHVWGLCIASAGSLMASTTQMMMAMYAFNSGMSSLKQSRAEDRQLLEGNQFKLIPSQSFDLAFKTSLNETDLQFEPGSGAEPLRVRSWIRLPVLFTVVLGIASGPVLAQNPPQKSPENSRAFFGKRPVGEAKDYAQSSNLLRNILQMCLRPVARCLLLNIDVRTHQKS